VRQNYRYILTERGKFLVALLVAFVLVLSLVVLTVWALSRNSSLNNASQNNSVSGDSGDNSENPYNSSQGSSGSTGSESLDPSLSGPIGFDLDEGLLLLLFSPDKQNALDNESVSLIGELLKSPMNIRGTKIAIEIPRASDEDTAKITTAVLDAFSTYDVSVNNIQFYIYEPETNIRTFLINISFR